MLGLGFDPGAAVEESAAVGVVAGHMIEIVDEGVVAVVDRVQRRRVPLGHSAAEVWVEKDRWGAVIEKRGWNEVLGLADRRELHPHLGLGLVDQQKPERRDRRNLRVASSDPGREDLRGTGRGLRR